MLFSAIISRETGFRNLRVPLKNAPAMGGQNLRCRKGKMWRMIGKFIPFFCIKTDAELYWKLGI